MPKIVFNVPNYCWKSKKDDYEICEYFTNDGGYPFCEIFQTNLKEKYTDVGLFVYRCEECQKAEME